jgi:hypothetical protein
MSRKCKACGSNAFRAGTLAVVFGGGRHEGGIVCPKCAREGILLVASKVAPVVKHETPPDERVKGAMRQLQVLIKAASLANNLDKQEGLESALELLKRAFC